MDVVLLHGLGADRNAFQRFERLLPEEWEVERWDLLGHGSAPHPAHGYALEDHGDYVAGRIAERWSASPARPPVLVGHSYGAGTAVVCASRHQQLVRAVVLLDPIAYARQGERDLESKTELMMRARREGTLKTVVPELFPHFARALQQWTITTWENMAVGVIEEIDHDWMRFAGGVSCPAAIIHGDLEHGGAGDIAADWFDDPVVGRIAGAGHYLHATHAHETAAAVVAAVEQMVGGAQRAQP